MSGAKDTDRAIEYARRLTAAGVEDDGNILSRALLATVERAEKAEVALREAHRNLTAWSAAEGGSLEESGAADAALWVVARSLGVVP